ncbi:unnamed protein product [Rodentolepis nana]|uniref:alpha-L-fucosidase n=1 Tax=Rodentolepis nana TaxID=102285 RepID=A0A0R3TYR9_RODNA|nr:unnamed protein product [Rodentolepis nana]
METLISVVAYGGNLLLNVGPTSWGTISPIFEERLLTMGQWLKINGDAIYRTKPWKYQVDSKQKKLWYLQKDSSVYALFSEWPNGESSPTIILSQVNATQRSSKFTLLDGGGGINLPFTADGSAVNITLPKAPPIGTFVAWAIRMDGVQPI